MFPNVLEGKKASPIIKILFCHSRKMSIFRGFFVVKHFCHTGEMKCKGIYGDWGDHVRVNTWMFHSRELFVLSSNI